MNNKEVVKWLKEFHKRILETDLSSKIYEQEMEAILDAIDLAENSSPVDIDTELYEVMPFEDYKTGKMKYKIYYGYVSSLRKDKNGQWHFRFSYYAYSDYDLSTNTWSYKELTYKSVHEIPMDQLYTTGSYTGKTCFRTFEDAQKAVEILRSK